MPSLLTPRRVLPLLLLAVILGGGSAWYAWVEGFGLSDGIYMAVITLTTVGYEEVRPLDERGGPSPSSTPSPASACCSTSPTVSWRKSSQAALPTRSAHTA